MNTTVQDVLASFDALSAAEQHEVTVEVLRRSLRSADETLSDDALRGVADELFQELDAREAADADPASR